jgi:hypothetical protein
MDATPPKPPLRGYRGIFWTFGVIMIAAGICWVGITLFGLFDLAAILNISLVLPLAWIAIGVMYILFAIRLRQPNLNHKHWFLGFLLMACGIVTGIGLPLIFSALMWSDADVKTHFTTAPSTALPGYRFLFLVFGAIMVVSALWGTYDFFFGNAIGRSSPRMDAVLVIAWAFIGTAYILFSFRLGKPGLTPDHWRMGRTLMYCGILTGVGLPFFFMRLTWSDADVKAHFSPKPLPHPE